MERFFLTLSLVVLWPVALMRAQVVPPNEMGVAMGHLHLNVRNAEAARKFWVLLGANVVKVGGADVLRIPGAFVFLSPTAPSGGSGGTVVNHVGVSVPNSEEEFIAKLKAAGVKTERGHVYSPDDMNIEIHEDKSVTAPIANRQIHLVVPESSVREAQAWYVKMFGAKPGMRGTIPIAEVPDVRLNFFTSPDAKLPTKGRALDHIGFEVRNLEAFCKKLEANGVKFDSPYSKSRYRDYASAEFTDPWGTSIELTEGLSRF